MPSGTIRIVMIVDKMTAIQEFEHGLGRLVLVLRS